MEACLSSNCRGGHSKTPGKQGPNLSVNGQFIDMKYVKNLVSLRFSRGTLIEWENLMKTTVWQDVLLELDCTVQFSLCNRTDSLSVIV